MQDCRTLVDGYLAAGNRASFLRKWTSSSAPTHDYLSELTGYVARRLLNGTLTYAEALHLITDLASQLGEVPPELRELQELLQGAYAECPRRASSDALAALRDRYGS
jgi:hypothetical protein